MVLAGTTTVTVVIGTTTTTSSHSSDLPEDNGIILGVSQVWLTDDWVGRRKVGARRLPRVQCTSASTDGRACATTYRRTRFLALLLTPRFSKRDPILHQTMTLGRQLQLVLVI